MVGPSYLLQKPQPTPAAKVIFDQRVFPLLIDGAADVEAVLERLAVRTKAAPGTSLALAFGFGALLSLLSFGSARNTVRRRR